VVVLALAFALAFLSVIPAGNLLLPPTPPTTAVLLCDPASASRHPERVRKGESKDPHFVSWLRDGQLVGETSVPEGPQEDSPGQSRRRKPQGAVLGTRTPKKKNESRVPQGRDRTSRRDSNARVLAATNGRLVRLSATNKNPGIPPCKPTSRLGFPTANWPYPPPEAPSHRPPPFHSISVTMGTPREMASGV
jgi:hypothetical protein